MVVRLGLGARTVEYNAGWELQRQIHERRVAGDAGDCCLLLEHQPVYTAGKRTSPARPAASAIPAHRSSTSTAAARSPGTVLASWSATRSWRWTSRST